MTSRVYIDSGGAAGVWRSPMGGLLALGGMSFLLYGASELLEHALAHVPFGGDLRRQVVLYLLYLLVTAGIFGCYAMILGVCRRGELAQGRIRTLAFGMACALQVGLALVRPQLSQDLLSYTAQGFLGVIGHNPMAEPAAAVKHTVLGPALAAEGWRAVEAFTPYGIIWTWIEIGAMRLSGGHLPTALLLLKGVALGASLLSAYMLGRFLERVAPRMKDLGVLAYLWNPLILVELAGEGHNDALLLLCTMVALLACVAGKATVSVVGQLCGVLTKYVAVLLIPPQLVYLWRTRQEDRTRLMGQLVAGGLITAGLGALLYAPLWLGMHSFDGLTYQGTPRSSASLSGVITWALMRSPLAGLSGPATMVLIGLPTLIFIGWISWGVRTAAQLARAFAWIAVFYLLVTSPVYWPWYACLPVMLLLAADARRYLWVVMLLSVVARVVAPLDLLYVQGFLSMQVAKGLMSGLGTTVPLLVLLAWAFLRSPPKPARGAPAAGLHKA